MILENKVKLNSNSNQEIFFVKEYKKNIKEQVKLKLKKYKAN